MPKLINPSLSRSPYYIVAPRYIRTSAGIRCLHVLCHWLNRLGERAFIALYCADGAPPVSWDLQTPLLTQSIIDYHYGLGVRPIVIYPEVVAGNPLEAECVVRWLLNFPAFLGGDSVYADSELPVAFSKVLAASVGGNAPVLHAPVLNEEVFYPGEPRKRSGVAYYAMKYKNVHRGKVFGLPRGAIEITRDRLDSQTPEQIAEILRSVEALYVFENTALATEAVLCGCPAVFMPNQWLDKPIALEELGWDGYAWGNAPDEVERARNTVAQGQANYHRTVDEFFVQLDNFIALSQAKADEGRYELKINPSFLVLPSNTGGMVFSQREIARLIKLRPRWSFSGWVRINRAVFSVAWRRFVREPLRRQRQRLVQYWRGPLGGVSSPPSAVKPEAN
jgi:hypothetical protein